MALLLRRGGRLSRGNKPKKSTRITWWLWRHWGGIFVVVGCFFLSLRRSAEVVSSKNNRSLREITQLQSNDNILEELLLLAVDFNLPGKNADETAAATTTTTQKEEEPVVSPSSSSSSSESFAAGHHHDQQHNNNFPFYFSACLLIKDDNPILPEWLAYHYTVLPLRRLIVAVDPNNVTNPEPILNAFAASLDMNITIWRDDDYHLARDKIPAANATHEAKFAAHYIRQKQFLKGCIGQLRKESASTWTLLVDSDEYITLNHYVGEEEKPKDCRPTINLGKHKYRGKCYKRYHEDMKAAIQAIRTNNNNNASLSLMPPPQLGPQAEAALPRLWLPKVGSPNSTLAHVIAGQTQVDTNQLFEKYGCICLPRVLFGPGGSSQQQQQSALTEDLHTLSHQLHHQEWENDKPTKCIVDTTRNHDRIVVNPHRTYHPKNLCLGGPQSTFSTSLFRIHHYLGTLQEFIARPDDVHRTPQEYYDRFKTIEIDIDDPKQQNNQSVAPPPPPPVVDKDSNDNGNGIVGWWDLFVSQVGYQTALDLTVGLRDWAIQNDAKIVAAAAATG